MPAICVVWATMLALLHVATAATAPATDALMLQVQKGVDPALFDIYNPTTQTSFACMIHGREQLLSFDRVNDDYCDCDDGKDEPGTSACSHLTNAMFHCYNGGFFPLKIHTSRVQDGICDCCDGSDERVSVKCENTCLREAATYKKAAEDRLRVVQTGFEKRQHAIDGEIAAYFSQMHTLDETTDKTLESLAQLKDRVTIYKNREERKEMKMRVEQARKKQTEDREAQERAKKTCENDDHGEGCGETTTTTAPNAETTPEATAPAPDTPSEPVAFEALDAEKVMAMDPEDDQGVPTKELSDDEEEESHRVKNKVKLADGTRVPLAEYLRMDQHAQVSRKRKTPDKMRREDFLGPLFNGDADGRRQMGIYALRSLGLLCSPVRGVFEVLAFVPRTLWELAVSSDWTSSYMDKLPEVPSPSRWLRSSITFRRLGGGRFYRWYRLTTWSASVAWDAPTVVYEYLFPTLDDQLKLPEAESLRAILREIEDDMEKLKREKATRKDQAEKDYGPHRAFFMLRDQCMEHKIEKYTYKFCAFQDVKQDHTNLGRFDGWSENADQTKDYSIMKFAHGQRCWNGPERSVQVQLTCGDANAIVSVDEPSTCVYQMKVTTPAACTKTELDKAQADVAFWSRATA